MYPTSLYAVGMALMAGLQTATAQDDFYEWKHQRVALPNSSIHFRYAGSGPPILLIHGVPEHSPTWDTIGPILARNHTVIAPDNRGCGDSSLALDDNYSAATAASDLKLVLNFLNITQVDVVSHDKGAGIAAALAASNRALINRVVFSEYVLPGFGLYEASQTPSPTWTVYSNWQLAFFSVPEAAEFFLRGRERDYLTWYFYHTSYSGNAVVSEAKLETYERAVRKPGFLRAGFRYFGSQWEDAAFFNATIRPQPLEMPSLVLGGEASLGPYLREGWEAIVSNTAYDVIPKAGHWMGDENPIWVANRVLSFLSEGGSIPSVDLTVLDNQVSLIQQYAMGNTPGKKAKRSVAQGEQSTTREL